MSGDKAKMRRPSLIPDRMFPNSLRKHVLFPILISLVLLGLLLPTGCLFRKHRPPAAPTLPAPVRIVLLPLNFPRENTDLRWVSLASAVLEAEIVQSATDLEPVPLWESMPAVLQILGDSRAITTGIAEFTATRLTARWAIQGELSAVTNDLLVRMDFIPARPSLVPFRYEKQSSMDGLDPHFREAFDQFLRYLIVRPLATPKIKLLDAKSLKELADALDAEYGWFETAKAGEAAKVVQDLAHSNPSLARLLFNPAAYPVLGK